MVISLEIRNSFHKITKISHINAKEYNFCKMNEKFLELQTLMSILTDTSSRYVSKLNAFVQWCNVCFKELCKNGTLPKTIVNDGERIQFLHINSEYDQHLQGIDNHRNEIVTLFRENLLHQIKEVQNMVMQRLYQWKREQFLQANQLPCAFKVDNGNNVLDQIQNRFDQLFCSYMSVRQIIDNISDLHAQADIFKKNDLDVIRNEFSDLLKKLIASSIVIEKQPPQVIKKDTR